MITRDSNSSRHLYSVGTDNTNFVAAGQSGTVLRSGDSGVTWEEKTWALRQNIEGVAYGDSKFVIVSDGSNSEPGTSSDGNTWLANGNVYEMRDIIFGNNLFVGVGDAGSVYYTNNGLNFTNGTSNTSNHLYGITYGNSKYVAVGYNITTHSTDGSSWTISEPSVLNRNIYSVAYGDSKFIAVGDRVVMTSTDGISWATKSTSYRYFYDIIYANSKFLAVSTNETIYTTTDDGTTWVKVHDPNY